MNKPSDNSSPCQGNVGIRKASKPWMTLSSRNAYYFGFLSLFLNFMSEKQVFIFLETLSFEISDIALGIRWMFHSLPDTARGLGRFGNIH